MRVKKRALVTGGSGFFGEILVQTLLERDWEVYNLDLNPNTNLPLNSQFIGDIRNLDLCHKACEEIDVVFHNVAQVPLAKNNELFESVNVKGTETILLSASTMGVKTFVFTSSSAIYGIPKKLPITKFVDPRPMENYGSAKLKGEILCRQYFGTSMEIKIVRPRTILGAGRLGIFGLLFYWISKGLDVYVLGKGEGCYQFISPHDLAQGMINAVDVPGDQIFNLGALDFGSFSSELNLLCQSAQTKSRIRNIPEVPFRRILLVLSKLRVFPFASYQLLLYGKAMYFDCEEDWRVLNYVPRDSNLDCLIQGYKSYSERENNGRSQQNLSVHKMTIEGKLLSLLTLFLRFLKRIGL